MGVGLGIYLGQGMAGNAWGEIVDELRPAAAAPAVAGNETDLDGNETDLAPVSDAGAVALATSSAAVKRCLRARSMP